MPMQPPAFMPQHPLTMPPNGVAPIPGAPGFAPPGAIPGTPSASASASASAPPPPPISPQQNPSEALRYQLEYYFSDENLFKDFFLRQNMDFEGWVPLDLILSFKRVKIITQQGGVDVGQVLGQCGNLEVSEDGHKVRARR